MLDETAVAITVIVMAGLFLTATAWQILTVARERTRPIHDQHHATYRQLQQRIEALEQAAAVGGRPTRGTNPRP